MANKAKATSTFVGENLTVELTDYQLGRIVNGCASLFNDSTLVAVGVAHCAAKKLKGLPGDEFTKWKAEGPAKKALLCGPTDPLVLKKLRVVIFKQPSGEYIHCLYTDEHITFVDLRGNCLYLHRLQVLEPNGKPESIAA